MIVVMTLDIVMDKMNHLVKARTIIAEISQVEIRHIIMVLLMDVRQLKAILEMYVNPRPMHKMSLMNEISRA